MSMNYSKLFVSLETDKYVTQEQCSWMNRSPVFMPVCSPHIHSCWCCDADVDVQLHSLPDFSSPALDTDVPCWRLSLWATWTASATHCHRRRCTLTRPTSRWAYSREGMGCGRPQPRSLKSNSSTEKDQFNNIYLCVLHHTFGSHITTPRANYLTNECLIYILRRHWKQVWE